MCNKFFAHPLDEWKKYAIIISSAKILPNS